MKNFRFNSRFWLVKTVLLALLLSACGSSHPDDRQQQPAAEPAAAEAAQPVTVQNGDRVLTFEQPPKRAVTLNQHTTEIMLALGLADRMAGTAYLDDRILPEYQEAYEKIPVLSKTYPSKEVLLAAEPDFVYAGWKSAFTDKAVGTVEELEKLGIKAYLHQSSNMTSPTLEDVYTDIRNIGRIFRVEAKADELIARMNERMEQIAKRIGQPEKPPRVFVYDSGEDQPLTAANNYMTRLIAMAGGKNIFDDIPKGWATVNWEEVVNRQPDVIVIVDYGDKTVEQKRELLLSKKELADLPAIRNQKLIVLPLSAAAEGVRAPMALEALAKGFYPEKFQD